MLRAIRIDVSSKLGRSEGCMYHSWDECVTDCHRKSLTIALREGGRAEAEPRAAEVAAAQAHST